MNNRTRDLVETIRGMIHQETRYLRHYIGQVVDRDDPASRGRVKVCVYELGWQTPDTARWCWPRMNPSLVVPMVDEWVEVYFMSGDRSRPVYLAGAAEMADMVPQKYTGPKIEMLLATKDKKGAVRYDEESGLLELLEGAEPFVLGDTLNTFLGNVKSWMDGHSHGPGTYSNGGGPVIGASGGPLVGSPAVAAIRSQKIKGV